MTLYAKSGRNAPTILVHTEDVCAAGAALFGTAEHLTRLGREWLRFFKLADADRREFADTLLAACLFHDWGKANADMQAVLRNERTNGQLFRHEHLSVLMLGVPGVVEWLEACKRSVDWDIVLAAVGSHHLKFDEKTFAQPQSGKTVRMHADAAGFGELVGFTAERLGIAGAPVLPKELHWGFARGAGAFHVGDLRERLGKERLRKVTQMCFDRTARRARLLNAVRAGLIAADAAGSGLRRTDHDIAGWVTGQFPEEPKCDAAFVRNIIERRVEDLTRRGRWEKWNEFQDKAATLPDRALLLAPCGAGKTLAAWRWIEARAAERPVNRVLFLYPTRATATEGFKDYVSWAPEADASLLHGTSGYDLDGMFPAEDPRSGKFAETDPRLFALQHWPKSVFSATVDQFLAFLSYAYGPVCVLPLLADSVVVVDEVHSFDKSMFSALERFLDSFDVPVLCMTATLQAGRLGKLETRLEKYAEREGDLKKLADSPRYKVARTTAADAEGVVRAAAEAGKRVLWVTNQVNRCQANAAGLAGCGADVICYHSRFKLTDRRDRHQETVRRLRPDMPAVVVCSTQVCEMSLDCDADVLVTEECPIPSLIQRMGRCRRGREELRKGPGEVYVYKPDDERVYAAEDLHGLIEFVDWLAARDAVSQADLEAGMERFGSQAVDATREPAFLFSGAYALAGQDADSFRDIEAHNAQCVLDADADGYAAADKSREPAVRARLPGFIVPVPKKLRPQPDSRLPHYLRLADARHYAKLTGYHDDPLTGG